MAKKDREEVILPSQVTDDVGWFDRFAEKATSLVARAPFFSLCVALVVLWFPTLFLMPIDSSQLIINTTTTIITFLMVALLENSTKRSDQAVQHKLNAVAEALIDILQEYEGTEKDQDELRRAVGLELKEST